jgi:hypothetical protein
MGASLIARTAGGFLPSAVAPSTNGERSFRDFDRIRLLVKSSAENADAT